MFKRSWYVLCLFAFLIVPTGVPAAKSQELTVMTRNLYLGAALAPAITAQTPDEFFSAAQAALAQIAANNFPERAQALAAEIVEKKPHFVGLQEVYNFTLNGSNGLPPFRNYLTDLTAALAAQGADYKVAAVVKDTDIQVPLGEGLVLGLTDSDVILARGDVTTFPVSMNEVCAIEKRSVDGCNYQSFASITTPLGITIEIKHGFVAIDTSIGNVPVRFVNTHLEPKDLIPTNLLIGKFYQAGQAYELLSILANLPNSQSAKIIVVGDINSSPQDQIVTMGPYTIVPPYKQLVNAGYTDTWTLRPGDPPGFTCCQAGNLLNLESILEERIDVTFTGELPSGMVKVNVVGNEETDKTPSGLWPSDHAGVVTRLEFAP